MAGTNPYIVGSPIGQPLGFFGRANIFEAIEEDLIGTDRHPIVLYGQRRIGKTSILRQLQRRLASQQYLPVYFDLMTRAYHPLDQVLFELADPTHHAIDSKTVSFEIPQKEAPR